MILSDSFPLSNPQKSQPTHTAWPNRLSSYFLSPAPSLSLLSFPFTVLGPVTPLSPTFSLHQEFLGNVSPYLIWLLSPPVTLSPLLIRWCAL